MKWKILLVLITVWLAPRPTLADETTDVRKAIEALNSAFERREGKAVRRMMTADHVAVTSYYGGPLGRDQLVKGLPDHALTQYQASRLKVRMLGKDAALLTYELAMKGTYKGKPVPAKSSASAVWVREGGRWLEAYYQETAY